MFDTHGMISKAVCLNGSMSIYQYTLPKRLTSAPPTAMLMLRDNLSLTDTLIAVMDSAQNVSQRKEIKRRRSNLLEK
jgi:hypothetical protein